MSAHDLDARIRIRSLQRSIIRHRAGTPVLRALIVGLCLAGILSACANTLAVTNDASATNWPGFMPDLQPGPPNSPVATQTLPDTRVDAPAPEIPPERARWSGHWQGWAGMNQVDAITLVVERLTVDTATIVMATASGAREPWTERLEARFVDGELRTAPRPGSRVNFRMRDEGTLEMLWQADDGWWLAGVLERSNASTDTDTFPVRSVHRVLTAPNEHGRPDELETILFTPPGTAPFPTMVFNHGSTGYGDDPELFGITTVNPVITRFFNDRGWMVVFPQRRGRGASDGVYAEGLAEDGSGYSADPLIAAAGIDRALIDIDAVVQWLRLQPQVDRDRLLVGGESRGGLLAIAYAGAHPRTVRGAINFVGGWLGDRVPNAERINREGFRRGTAFPGPTLWLYGEDDLYYRLTHSRENFDAFQAGGGTGSFHELPVRAGGNGHFIGMQPGLWVDTLDDYLESLLQSDR